MEALANAEWPDALAAMRQNANTSELPEIYDRMARYGPLLRIAEKTWLAVAFSTCARVLGDRAFGVREQSLPEGGSPRDFDLSFNRMNAPEHGRLRSTVAPAFAARALAGSAEQIRREAERLVSGAVHDPELDFVRDVAEPLPLRALSRLIGVPASLHEVFAPLARTIGGALDGTHSAEDADELIAAWRSMNDLLTDLLRAATEPPEPSLLASLRAASMSRVSDHEAGAILMLIATAGYATTVQAIAGGTLALAAEPREWEKLRADPGLVPNASHEILRYTSPVLAVSRVALADTIVSERTVRKGQEMIVALGAANRDPSEFVAPHRLKVDRMPAKPDLAFAHGAHGCLGRRLALLEIEAVLSSMRDHVREVSLAADPTWLRGANLRGLASLPLSLRNRSRAGLA